MDSESSLLRDLRAAAAAVLLGLLVGGCVGLTPTNAPLEVVDAARGYRPSIPSQHREPGQVFMLLAFSGGGTRAAAFAYGVLEELRDTNVVVRGERKRLLEEVDTISGVSGGSFPAAYYGLFGDRIFEDFEERFLKENVQGALIRQALRPKNFFRLITFNSSRSELATQYYDKNIFDGATFADLTAAQGPRIYINATDLSHGYRFTFSQGQFDLICADLDPFLVSRAVAASSAVPGLLSPITLVNRAGTCGFEPHQWLKEALESRRKDPRRYRAARSVADYLDPDQRPYVHLVDGGISDNLGLRASLETTALVGGIENLRRLFGVGIPDHLVLVVVNAETDPNPTIDLSSAGPGLALLMNSVSGGQIRRYNFETMLLAREALRQNATDLSKSGHRVEAHFVEVSFDSIPDRKERRHFKGLPTSFSLKDEEVDALREVGRRLLRESPDFQSLLARLQ
jgi:NTE family protein